MISGAHGTTVPAGVHHPNPREDAATAANPREDAITVERCGWSLVWFASLIAGIGFWGSWTSWPAATVISPLLTLIGIAGIAAVWLVRDPVSRTMQRLGLAGALVTVIVPQAAAIHSRQYYTTDSAAFNHVAASVLLQGKNPYATSMAPAAKLLKTAYQFWTYTANGGHVSQVSYPAGSFLLDVPAMALGFHRSVVDWVDLVAWLVFGVLIFWMLPVAYRWFALLIALTSSYVLMFSNGGTDALFMPFLALAVWRWDRFGTGKVAGVTNWIGPVSLGLACSIKQTPWFCVPFLLAGVAIEAKGSGRIWWAVAARYLGIVAGVFLAVNLPFIAWGPAAWLNGTLLPFTHPLVADGQGLVTLALHGLTGGVELPYLSVAGLLVYAALFIAYVLWFPQMKRVWLFVLPLVLFIPARSLSSYLIDFFPIAIVGALCVARPVDAGHEADTGVRRWKHSLAVAVPAVMALVATVIAFTSAPLDVSVSGYRTSRQNNKLDSVTVVVHNVTGHMVTPHFLVTINGGGHPSGFWRTATGHHPLVLGPGASATVTLVPNAYTFSPVWDQYWLVEAYTASPETLSTSALQLWHPPLPKSGGRGT